MNYAIHFGINFFEAMVLAIREFRVKTSYTQILWQYTRFGHGLKGYSTPALTMAYI